MLVSSITLPSETEDCCLVTWFTNGEAYIAGGFKQLHSDLLRLVFTQGLLTHSLRKHDSYLCYITSSGLSVMALMNPD